ncbi:MAG: beta-ketoacyl-ACP synthase II [Gammaproteobacteria bacterium]|nr:beta-ketoacyl-ACP synthase II [Gammaproteobacteria bacterium]
MGKRRVVVTGMGMVSPVGLNVQDTWNAIVAGKSGVAKIEHFDASAFTTQICATVKNFNCDHVINLKDQKKMDLFIQYGMVAADEAIRDSGIEINETNAHRIGVSVGSGIGGLPLIQKNHRALLEGGPRKISPFFIPAIIINLVSGHISISYGAKGPNLATVTACTTGTHNIGLAGRTIQYGDADVMICGGTEMASYELGIGGFAAMRALSTRNDDPERASRPWDKDRDGFILADGAGVLVLEEYEHAKKRGAKIYAELIGFGMSADAYHMTTPEENGAGASSCMLNTLNDAKINVDQIDYINAHGTSTQVGDEIEIRGIKKALGSYVDQVAISSTKSMTGHLLGAAGAVEAIFSILAIRDQVAPPTINLDNPSEDCGDVNLVPHHAQQRKIDLALSNSFGFGGTNGSLLFSKLR